MIPMYLYTVFVEHICVIYACYIKHIILYSITMTEINTSFFREGLLLRLTV